MNVSCPNCATIYRVDPAKVPEGGVRARCNVCSAVFAVRREGEAESAAAMAAKPPARSETPAPLPPRPEPPKAQPPPPEPARLSVPAAPPRPAAPAPASGAPRPAAPPPLVPGPAAGGFSPAPPAGLVPPAAPASPASPLRPPAPARPPAVPAAPAAPAAPKPAAPLGGSSPAPQPRAAPSAPGGRPANPFLSQDPSLKARRLARALISDMVVYHPGKRQEGLRDGNLKELFEDEIKKSWEEYAEQVGRDLAESTPFFREALNEILAGGRQVF
jgi:predicted Zn finger-like uncharacterized protein